MIILSSLSILQGFHQKTVIIDISILKEKNML